MIDMKAEENEQNGGAVRLILLCESAGTPARRGQARLAPGHLTRREEVHPNAKVCPEIPLLHHHALPDGGRSSALFTVLQNAGGPVPQDRHAGGGGGHVLQRHAAAADRSRHHQHLRALLHPGRQHRPQRIALADRRKPHQDLLQARHRSQRRREQHRQPRHGRSAPPAARARCRPWCSAWTPPPSPSAWSRSRARA